MAAMEPQSSGELSRVAIPGQRSRDKGWSAEVPDDRRCPAIIDPSDEPASTAVQHVRHFTAFRNRQGQTHYNLLTIVGG